jgi:hypothetical protein
MYYIAPKSTGTRNEGLMMHTRDAVMIVTQPSAWSCRWLNGMA